jgi:hypothetical protein
MNPERMICFSIPASFVVENAPPTIGELAAGFVQGWLDEASVVEVALAKLNRGLVLTEPEERLAYLLSDQFDDVADILREPAFEVGEADAHGRYWLSMALAWVLRSQGLFDDPLGVVELLYADFGYPPAIEGLVRYMPQPEGAEPGTDGLMTRWAAYVEREMASHAERASRALGKTDRDAFYEVDRDLIRDRPLAEDE